VTQPKNKGDFLRDLLGKELLNITFVKSDGTVRVLHCTLHPNFLPVRTEDQQPQPTNPQLIRAWDIDLNAWRAFRIDRIKSVTVNICGYDVPVDMENLEYNDPIDN